MRTTRTPTITPDIIPVFCPSDIFGGGLPGGVGEVLEDIDFGVGGEPPRLDLVPFVEVDIVLEGGPRSSPGVEVSEVAVTSVG